jgi:transcriptional regulator with XRE-family HTH domain
MRLATSAAPVFPQIGAALVFNMNWFCEIGVTELDTHPASAPQTATKAKNRIESPRVIFPPVNLTGKAAKAVQSGEMTPVTTKPRMTGSELKHARKARGLSRRALADLAGLHPDSIWYWERKTRVDLRGYAPDRILRALGLGDLLKHRSSGAPGEFLHTVTRARGGLLPQQGISLRPKRCGAQTRKGTPCRAKALPGKTRCKFHGGASTGPRTAEGKARIAEAQRKRWAAWRAGRDKSAFEL